MIMFLVINISSIQLIPFTMLKIRIDAGSVNPNEIIITNIICNNSLYSNSGFLVVNYYKGGINKC